MHIEVSDVMLEQLIAFLDEIESERPLEILLHSSGLGIAIWHPCYDYGRVTKLCIYLLKQDRISIFLEDASWSDVSPFLAPDAIKSRIDNLKRNRE